MGTCFVDMIGGESKRGVFFVKWGLGIWFVDMIGGESERSVILFNGVLESGLET